MRIRPRFLVGACLIAAAIIYLIATAIHSTAEYYLTVSEVHARQAGLVGQPLRIAGRVEGGTINWNPATLTLAFSIVAPPKSTAGGVTPVSTADPVAFPVICKGNPKPDMFKAGRDVIVEGRLSSDGTIVASQVLTQCPSKYTPKKPG